MTTDPSEFDPMAWARAELLPLLEMLCRLAEAEGAEDQREFFRAACVGIEQAQEAATLADVFMHLSMSAFRGFDFSPTVAVLLDQVLEMAQHTSEALSIDDAERH